MLETRRAPVIFMYHSVRETANGGPYGIEIAPDRFERHIAFLTSHYRVAPLTEFIDALSSRARAEGMAAITFDDAFVDNLDTAAAILRKYRAPATVYVPTGLIGRPYFWWDALPRLWSAGPDSLAAAEPEIRARFPDLAFDPGPAFQKALWDRVRRAPLDEAYRLVECLAGRFGVTLNGLPRPATERELPRFARWPFDIGSHAVTHRSLTSLTLDELHEEVHASRRYLTDRIGRPPATFSYPFGLCDRDVRETVRAAGYRGAVTVTPRIDGLLSYGDPFELPRIDAGFGDVDELTERLEVIEERNRPHFVNRGAAAIVSPEHRASASFVDLPRSGGHGPTARNPPLAIAKVDGSPGDGAATFAAFRFPLNIYAELVRRETGQVKWLHFALFENPDEPISDAQRRSTDLLLAQLPPPPARILEVGSGLGTLLAELVGRGYDATGINPDAAQVAVARSRFGADLPVVETSYEAFTLAPGAPRFDVILFQESAQYIGSLQLFDRALDLLKPDGSLVILDEFVIRTTSWTPESLHSYDHIAALAERLGFTVEAEQDLTSRAAPTVDTMLKAVRRHRRALESELGVPGPKLDAHEASNQFYQTAYAEGRFGYRLVVLRRGAEKGWRLRAMTGERHPEFAELYRETFGQEMSLKHWNWKYGEGRGFGVGLWIDGRLAVNYGGVSRSALVFGHPARMALPGDVMARKRNQRSIARHSPFFVCAATALEIHMGFGTPHLVAAGFPNAKANRGPRLLGLYSEGVDRVVELHWPLAPDHGATPAIRPLNDPYDAGARRAVDALWEKMADSLRSCVVAVRDWRSLVQRYLDHPDMTYEIHLAPDAAGDGFLGAIVLRRTAEDYVELLDLVGPLDAMPALVAVAKRVAAAKGARELWGWFAEHCVAERIAGPECKVCDIQVETPTFIWRPGISPEDLRGRIWLTGGDTDFH